MEDWGEEDDGTGYYEDEGYGYGDEGQEEGGSAAQGDWKEPRYFETMLVEVHGMTEKVSPLRQEGGGGSLESFDANGKLGRAVDFNEETDRYVVFTFEGVLIEVPEDSLRQYEPPPPQESGFDVCWPYFDEHFFDFCADVNNLLIAKHWCLIQVSKNDASREEALMKAKRKDFMVPKLELQSDFMGRKGRGKISYVDPLNLLSVGDVQNARQPYNELEQYDTDISSLFGVMGPMTWDSMGFNSYGRTEGMAWLPFSSQREENMLTPESLNEDDIEEDGLIEKHLHFLRRRKLCFLYMVSNDGGQLVLYPREDLKMDPIELPVVKGRMLVFRCDLMSFKFQPAGSHLTLLSWVLNDPPKMEVGDIMANDQNRSDLLGISKGPLIPTGERAHIMAVSCLTGGGVYCTADAQAMYMAGSDASTYVPSARFETDLYFSKHGEDDFIPGMNSYHVHGGMVYDEEVQAFDNKFFGITDHEASIMWPNQRKVLEVGYDCLFRAGFDAKTVQGQSILVYLGDCGAEWWSYLWPRQMEGEHLGREESKSDWEAARSMAITSTRLSYTFGLNGPTWLADTACSSGLTAFCTAMYSMKKPTERGTEAPSMDLHCSGCLAGGVNMIVDAGVYIGNCASHMLSLKGRCFTFDSGGDGYARGEGCSIAYTVVSNSDKDSELQEGCAIGNKVNQDGRSASMTAPNGPAQQMCIKASLKEAGVEPHDISCSECHGTGTSLGDPIEVGSLRGVQETDDRDGPLINTSSKSNIGHLEANAGITGLFKCIQMAKYAVALPGCHLRSLNPHLDITGWPAYMSNEVMDFGTNSGMCGVSSFGVSGTNAHAEVWGICRCGPWEAGRAKMTMDKIHQLSLTCPVTLGPIDHLTGEPVRPMGGRRYNADVLRDELATYDVSSYAYEGGYRYRREALNDGQDLFNPEGVKVCVCGSWSGWSAMEEMEQQEDGSYMATMILGETRCERFYICANENKDARIYPAINNASQRIHIQGPDAESGGKCWIIDGRDEEVPACTVYQIRFWWGNMRKRILWEEVSPKFAADALHYEHRYQVMGSWTCWQKHEIRRDPEDDNIWEYSLRIGLTGEEQFQLCRDNDDHQLIYPARPKALKTSVPVRGPDELGRGKYWLLRGPVDEVVKIRFEIDDGKITVAVLSETKGEKVWESAEGWGRHDYWLAFQSGFSQRMAMDPELPGVFRCRGTVGQDYSERHRGFCEFFNVLVDEDPNYAYYPEVGYASTGECIVQGPDDECAGRPFTIKSWQVGAGFEVVLDLTAVDRRKIVTWTWDTPPQYNFAGGVAILEA